MIEIKKGSLEERILKILMNRYPVKLSELQTDLRIKESTIKNSLNKLCRKGIIELEVLPGETFIRIIRSDLSFHGVNPVQKRGIIRKKTKNREVEEYEGMMYR